MAVVAECEGGQGGGTFVRGGKRGCLGPRQHLVLELRVIGQDLEVDIASALRMGHGDDLPVRFPDPDPTARGCEVRFEIGGIVVPPSAFPSTDLPDAGGLDDRHRGREVGMDGHHVPPPAKCSTRRPRWCHSASRVEATRTVNDMTARREEATGRQSRCTRWSRAMRWGGRRSRSLHRGCGEETGDGDRRPPVPALTSGGRDDAAGGGLVWGMLVGRCSVPSRSFTPGYGAGRRPG